MIKAKYIFCNSCEKCNIQLSFTPDWYKMPLCHTNNQLKIVLTPTASGHLLVVVVRHTQYQQVQERDSFHKFFYSLNGSVNGCFGPNFWIPSLNLHLNNYLFAFVGTSCETVFCESCQDVFTD